MAALFSRARDIALCRSSAAIPSQYSTAWYITIGPVNELWFTEPGLNQIGRLQLGP